MSEHPCPICRNLTFSSPDDIGDICPVCFWELEGGEDERDVKIPVAGPNNSLSIAQARENYAKYGAVEERFVKDVRPPLKSELPPS